jgi:SAM-dependent methyltransferase
MWRPTKYVLRDGRWRGSRDTTQVALSSRLIADRVADAYATAVQAHVRGDVLDLGCGNVPLYGTYRDLATSVMCVDWAHTLHPSRHLDLEVDLSGPLPLGDNEFDSIILTDVLEHLAYPDRLWGEMRRMLRTGGVVLVGVPFLYWKHEEPHDYHRYTDHRLRLFCADHGFEVLSLAPYGGAGDVIFDTVAKTFAARSTTITRLSVGLGCRLGRFSRATTSLPLGYVLVARKAT